LVTFSKSYARKQKWMFFSEHVHQKITSTEEWVALRSAAPDTEQILSFI